MTQRENTAGITITDLRCEYRSNPLGIDETKPRLGWVLVSDERGQQQTGYQVLVSSSKEGLHKNIGDLWDSGKVRSDQSVHVEYAGRALSSCTRCWWKVRVWDRGGLRTGWSGPAFWSMGLLESSSWKAQWIAREPERIWQDKRCQREAIENREEYHLEGTYQTLAPWRVYQFYKKAPYEPSPLLRKEFALDKPVTRATVFVTGLGYYELHLNGEKVGDHVLDPGWTSYHKRVLYEAYDVTKLLRHGSNAIGLMVGRGFYSPTTPLYGFSSAPWVGQPKALLQLDIELADETQETVITDKSWKTTRGPIVCDDCRMGEIYDARLEKPGWDGPGYDDSKWTEACVVRAPKGALHRQMVEPIKVTKTLCPVKVTNPGKGVYVFDFGRNIAGWVRMKVNGTGHRGRRILMQFNDGLRPDGTVHPRLFSYWKQHASYIMKGNMAEVFEPRFRYYGFQYVQIEGYPGTPAPESVEARYVHTAVESSGKLTCSNRLINRVHENIRRTQLNNMHSVPEDCPNREKRGWTGDAHVTAEEAIYNFRCPQFYAKYLNDLSDRQARNGGIPCNVPSAGDTIASKDAPAWSGAYVIIAWYFYLYYGDTRILARHYDNFKKYIAGIEQTHGVKAKPHIIDGAYGDWLPPYGNIVPPEGCRVTHSAYYCYCVSLMAKIAGALNRRNDARVYIRLAKCIQQAMHREFFNPSLNVYHGDNPGPYISPYRQTPNIFALFLDIVPKAYREAVTQNLLDDIVHYHNNHLNTGIMGTKVLMELLPEIDPETAYAVASQTTYPGWIWPILRYGATTVPEWWDGNVKGHVDFGSRNHPMFGSVGSYYYKHLAGIRVDPTGPGFKKIVIKPEVVGDLTWLKASYRSIRGEIISDWRLKGNHITLKVKIPVGATGIIHMPADSADSVTENGRTVGKTREITFLKMEKRAAVYRVKSGTYVFTSRLRMGDKKKKIGLAAKCGVTH